MRTPSIVLSGLLFACTASGPSDPTGGMGELVEQALGDLGDVSPVTDQLEHEIYQLEDTELHGDVTPESCDAVDEALAGVCNELYQSGQASWCNYTTSFFYAHAVPRCAVRFELFDDDTGNVVHPTYVLDFAGTPLQGPEPTCGNGVLDGDEDCDDGNHELWDGCDSGCNQEPFQGCEAVIEELYRQAGIAEVLAADWTGPRSHLMVNRQAHSMLALDQNACNAAIATAADVCNELTQQMPFVSWCTPGGMFHQDAGGPACSIRLQVWFDQLDADFGVYTTSLPGLLAFTIR